MKSARVERNLEAQKATYLWEALRPRAGEKPGRLLRNLILKGFGSVDAPTRRETMARALEFEDAVDDGVESARRAVFERFCALCDEQGRGNVLLSDFLNALTSARGGALWTPKRLDGAIDPVTTSVRWKNMTEAEARSVFSFFVTQFDERSQGMRMDYETFSRAVEHTGSPEVAAAYSLFTEIASVGVIAGQILEILTNPNIPSFSDETTWINPEEASRLYDDDEDEDEPPSDFAREAKLMTAAIRACRRNRPRDIEELVEVKGLYVDARDETSGGQTLLMIAAANGNKSTCKKLLLLGAAPNARDGHGRTAVDVAYQYNHFELAEYLRVHGVPRGDAARGFADSASPSKYRSEDSEKPRMTKFQNNDAFAHGDGHAVDDRSSVPSAPPMQSELVVAEVRSARVATDESELLTPD